MYLTPKFYPNTFNYWVLEDNILTKNPFMKALYHINLITAQIANALNTTWPAPRSEGRGLSVLLEQDGLPRFCVVYYAIGSKHTFISLWYLQDLFW